MKLCAYIVCVRLYNSSNSITTTVLQQSLGSIALHLGWRRILYGTFFCVPFRITSVFVSSCKDTGCVLIDIKVSNLTAFMAVG